MTLGSRGRGVGLLLLLRRPQNLVPAVNDAQLLESQFRWAIQMHPQYQATSPRPRRFVIDIPHSLLSSITRNDGPWNHYLAPQIPSHMPIAKQDIRAAPMNVCQRILNSWPRRTWEQCGISNAISTGVCDHDKLRAAFDGSGKARASN